MPYDGMPKAKEAFAWGIQDAKAGSPVVTGRNYNEALACMLAVLGLRRLPPGVKLVPISAPPLVASGAYKPVSG